MTESSGDDKETAPTPDRRPRMRQRTLLFLGLLVPAALMALVVRCSTQQVEPTDAPLTAATATVETVAPSAPEPASDWSYHERVDPMTDGITSRACVTSKNKAQLTWPYTPASADLCIRQSPKYGLDVFVALNGDGQIICRRSQDCTIPIRFGDGSAQSFSGGNASDGSSNMVFVVNSQRFVTAAKSADTIRVQLTFYQAGDQVLEFETKGLEWPRPDQ